MGFLVSPGVEVKETDLTNIIPALATSVGGFAGFFRWGPVNTPVNIGSETELARTFGTPIRSGEYETSFLTAASYLKYSNRLRVVRAVDQSVNAYAGVTGFTTGGDYTINNFEQLSNSYQSLETQLIRFVARYSGELGNSLGIAVFDSANPPTDQFKGNCDYPPNNTDWSTKTRDGFDPYISIVNDELTIIVYDKQGNITGTPGEILEVYQGLSYFKSAKDNFGKSIYWPDVLNNNSNFVWGVPWETDESGLTEDSYNNPIYLSNDSIFELQYGSDGTVESDNSVGAVGALKTALDELSDAETIDINLLFAHNFKDDDKTLQIDDYIIDIAEARLDCITFISAPLSIASATISSSDKKQALLDKFDVGGLSASSYAVFDSSPVYVYNRYRDAFAWIPACGHMAGLCAKTDRLQDPWFSPAGFNRGNLLGVTKLAYNPKQLDRDDLYQARINPIISTPGNGIILYGDKTAQAKPGAFDRINVRRLFITIEKAIATASKFLLFELNDEFTRASFRNAVEPYLRDVQGRRGITDFRVICDESNNTPDVIDSNRFVGTIYVKPTKSINYITLNFVAVRTGVSFEEVIGTNTL